MRIKCEHKESQEKCLPISRFHKGFTLIELLVVIAIISILGSYVMTSLSSAREKSRDGKRIAEIGAIHRALELYYDRNQSYPSTTPMGYAGTDAGVQLLASLGYIPRTPIPPPGINASYIYFGLYDNLGVLDSCTVTTTCSGFTLGITLERDDSVVLKNDSDHTLAGSFYGGNPDCANNTAGVEQCYDITR